MTPTPPGLVYYPDDRPGITRKRHGRGFRYLGPDGTAIDDRRERARIAALAVPPAYDAVWISPKRNGHLQATGRDARSRKQYRYHPDWTEFRARRKYDGLAEFGALLPRIRRRVSRDLNLDAGEQAFALAAVVAMIDRLSIRVGNPEYADENGTFGATTLQSDHLRLEDGNLHLSYAGKGGKAIRRTVGNGKLLRTLQRLDDLPGAELVSWLADDGTPRSVSSDQVNDYIAEIAGTDRHTAKTFRTWNGSAAALAAAQAAAGAGRSVTIKAMSEAASTRLANTPAIARKSYIHPAVIDLAEESRPLAARPPGISGLRQEERTLLGVLERWTG